ncbi:MAG: GNAT family N-acetyltransferase [Desulfobacteraceae bacterium]|nr:GNAT family N-acetyltransferase [Desulfobacteraceae bacterium]
MDIYPEIELSSVQHTEIETLRNKSFPDHQVPRSYYKQLPHLRAVKYQDSHLVGYMGLDYRTICVGDETYKVLGVIDLCINDTFRGQGFGTSMLSELSDYASGRDVDFIILISELHDFYIANGFQRINALNSWLRLHEHKNYGVAVEQVNELYVKSVSGKAWANGHVDWLGYMY